MKIKYGICDGLVFVAFDDDGNKYLLTEECVNGVDFETFAYGLPNKRYELVKFTFEIKRVASSKRSLQKTWDSLVNGAGFKKTVIDSVCDDLKEVIGI